METARVRWYLNDLSVQGQFPTAQAFVDSIGALATLRARIPRFGSDLYLSRSFGDRNVTIESTGREAILSAASRDAKGVILAWISKRGPFLDDDRQPEPDDYFEFDSNDVTDQGLGEAA